MSSSGWASPTSGSVRAETRAGSHAQRGGRTTLSMSIVTATAVAAPTRTDGIDLATAPRIRSSSGSSVRRQAVTWSSARCRIQRTARGRSPTWTRTRIWPTGCTGQLGSEQLGGVVGGQPVDQGAGHSEVDERVR